MVKYPLVFKEGGEEEAAERLYVQSGDDAWTLGWDKDAYLSSVTSKLCGLERLFLKVAIRIEVTYTNYSSHNLAHSRCSINNSDYMSVLLSDRVDPYLWLSLTLPSVFSTDSLDSFFQEADMDFFMGRNSLLASLPELSACLPQDCW